MNKTIEGWLRAGLMIAIGLGGTVGAAAQNGAALPAPSAPAALTGEARPVLGWVDFCARTPDECGFDAAEPSAIALTPKIWRTLLSVNRRVNATVRSVTDDDQWGVPDHWDLPSDGLGDCEDYQLLKRRLLSASGLPRRAMRMAVVTDEAGEGHAVLMVRTDRGDFVLDNKRDAVLPWHRTGYVFIKREGQSAAAAWVSLGGATSPATTANP